MKEFPQTEKEKEIYNFWRIRGWENVSAVLGNLNVHLLKKDKYADFGIDYIYLEQFFDVAKEQGKKDAYNEVIEIINENDDNYWENYCNYLLKEIKELIKE